MARCNLQTEQICTDGPLFPMPSRCQHAGNKGLLVLPGLFPCPTHPLHWHVKMQANRYSGLEGRGVPKGGGCSKIPHSVRKNSGMC